MYVFANELNKYKYKNMYVNELNEYKYVCIANELPCMYLPMN